MNLIDFAVLALVVLAVAHGVHQGAALQVLSFGGFWAGLLIGAAVAPAVSDLASGPVGTAFLTLFALLGLAVLGGALGRVLGTHAWGALQRLKLGPLDAALGALVAGIASLIVVWLFALLLAAAPTGGLGDAIQSSSIVSALVDRLPPAPSLFARIQRIIDESPFPRVFTGFEPAPAAPVDVPGDPVVQAAVGAAGRSTVKIVGLGCGGVQSGTGFVAAPGLVITNAHVVAGIDQPNVQDANGTHRATPVLFDPNLDVAVLRAPDLAGAPLTVVRDTVSRGTGGAIMGFPGGGDFQAGPAAVLRRFNAVGRDIYGGGTTTRDVYQLQARVRQGNSGGPFTTAAGDVIGVIFAASTNDPTVGYALTSQTVAERIEAAAASEAVDTGPCAA